MFGLLLLPLFIMLFALRVAVALAHGILWACRQGAACIITAALVFGAAWLFYKGINQ